MINNNTKKTLMKKYTDEYTFIKGLFSRTNVPVDQSDSSDSEEGVSDIDTENDSEHLQDGAMKTERATSLSELHSRLAAIKKDKKPTYQDKKLKTKLQNKLKKKKKVIENKSKRNTIYKEKTRNKMSTINSTESKPTKPVIDSNGNMVFSKFDFLGETTTVTDKILLSKDKGNKKQLLEKLKKTDNYVKKLEDTGNIEKANRIVEDTKWKNMIKKAEGIKVKDDPKLLKKSVAKRESQKRKSEKKWKERLENVEKKKEKRQKERKDNIEKRLGDKKKKMHKKAIKKGRYIPNAGI